MKLHMGRCLLHQRLAEAGRSQAELARDVMLRPERLLDYMENTRVMPLQVAASIAATLGCDVLDLYEWRREEAYMKE